MLSSVFAYLPKDVDPTPSVLDAGPSGKGPIQNDMWAVCSTTKKPVLAHLWLNFLLDQQNAYSNFVNFTGYQPPHHLDHGGIPDRQQADPARACAPRS